MLNANSTAVTESTTGNQGSTLANAKEVIWMPVPAVGSAYAPVTTITKPGYRTDDDRVDEGLEQGQQRPRAPAPLCALPSERSMPRRCPPRC